MRKWALGSFLILTLFQRTSAQHADLGTGVLKNQIWWFNWAGITISEGASRTFNTDDGLTIKVVFSNVTAHVPIPYVMNTFFGAVLHLLYDFSDPAIQPALLDIMSPTSFGYTMTVTASRGGVPVAFYFVTADAEASDQHEITTLHTNGSNWQTIQFFRNSTQTSNPLTGCGTQMTAISNTFSGLSQIGQNPILATLSPSASPLVVDAFFDHGGTTGGMALAFGVLQSVDRGDLPASYGTAQHQLLYDISNSCNFNPPYPSLDPTQKLKIGSVPGDADPIQYADDNGIGVDEDGVSTFPVYNGSGSYSVNVTLANTTGTDAYLTGWFDHNRDGVFTAGEAVTLTIPNNAGSALVTWTGLPPYLPQGIAGGYGFRFRISSDQQASQNATGFAKDGEVEDYLIEPQTLCSPLSLNVTSGPPVCAGQPSILHASGGTSYAWSPGTGLSDPSSSDPIATLGSTSVYAVTASDPQGCTANTTITVTINPAPSITISNDTTSCEGQPVSLMAAGGVNYTWTSSDQQTNATGPAISPSPVHPTKYYVLVKDNNGCSGIDSVEVNIHPLPAFSVTPGHPTICSKEPARLTASGGDQYAWIDNNGLPLGSSSSITINPADNTSFQVKITDILCQITATLSVPVTVNASPIIEVTKSNDLDCTLGQATLTATGGLSYQWTDIPGISELTSPEPVVRPLRSTIYYVKGTDQNGCSAMDSIIVLADYTKDLSHYPVPSAFSPNNDGHNDCFGLKDWGRMTSLELSIYSRWGERVFFTSDPQQCWDGTFKGVPQPAGGYVYQIKATTVCGTAYRKGIVLLIR